MGTKRTGAGVALAERMLTSALRRGRMVHAYLLVGASRSVLASAAKDWVATLLCLRSFAEEAPVPCGECVSCRKLASDNHPDVLRLEADGATLKLRQVDEALHHLWLRPLEGRFRCFVIEEADRLTMESANRLLKALEEPPPYGWFLLTATDPENLPETLVSRCQVVPIRSLPEDVMAADLQRRWDLSENEALALARLAGGEPGRAQEWMESGSFHPTRETVFWALARLGKGDPIAALDVAETFADFEAEELERVLAFMEFTLRDVWLFASGVPLRYAVQVDRAEPIAELAAVWGRFPFVECVEHIARARERLRAHVQPPGLLDVLMLDLQQCARTSRGERYDEFPSGPRDG